MASNWKLIVSDLDGTILKKDSTLSDKVINSVEKLRESGIDLTIATGRILESALPYITRLKITKPVILYNGAKIYDPLKKEYVYQAFFKENEKHQLFTVLQREGLHAVLFTENGAYVFNLSPLIDSFRTHDGIELKSSPLSELQRTELIKVMIIDEPVIIDKIQEKLGPELGEFCSVLRSEKEFLELLPGGVNKGTALERLCELLEISLDDTIAMGDNPNDFEMLKRARLGIAAGESHSALNEVADIVIAEDPEDVLEKLAKLLLKEG
ncbi:Cof-type HAD-IIB family hydrolase [Kosmotoga pacifica]|uniref:Haloacid dehalogenase n=1 Tax=Kosmotoga pacifica TaxID=1330330 RepID=A0A0G2Z768_9BACT|nr:Cof-type HAD-IIB family hydrolase [Kosmotoga pacifica]AKI97407.1 hypothetical protein IX53_05790 [Kosmotoga pacifica]